jgi:hypothetical protein
MKTLLSKICHETEREILEKDIPIGRGKDIPASSHSDIWEFAKKLSEANPISKNPPHASTEGHD